MKILASGNFWWNPAFIPAQQKAIKASLNAAGVIFSISAKKYTTEQRHVVTGRYRASIGNKFHPDGIFRFSNNDRALDVGSNVFYASTLENRYHILAIGYDMARAEIRSAVPKVFNAVLESNA